MAKSAKPMSGAWGNTAGKREGMRKGNAPAPPVAKVHDAGFGYASFAKSNPGVGGKGKK
jgi:hypothetical protein